MSDVCVWEDFLGGQAGGGEEGRSGYSTKNKNPTRQCGEKVSLYGNIFLKIFKIRLKYYIRNCNHIYIYIQEYIYNIMSMS